MDGERATNFEALHEKITGTEERLNDINEQTQKKFQIVKDNINKIQKQIEDERAKFDSYNEAKNNYVKVLENKINERVNQESHPWHLECLQEPNQRYTAITRCIVEGGHEYDFN